MARASSVVVEPVLLVRIIGAPPVGTIEIEIPLAEVATGGGLAVDDIQLDVKPQVGIPLVDDELVDRLVSRGVARQQLELVEVRCSHARVRQQLLRRRRVEALYLVRFVISGHALGDIAQCRRANTVQHVVDETVAVDRLGERHAHLGVV